MVTNLSPESKNVTNKISCLCSKKNSLKICLSGLFYPLYLSSIYYLLSVIFYNFENSVGNSREKL